MRDWANKRKTNAPTACRASKDKTVNERGNKFLDLIGSCDLTIINGCTLGDIFGEFTCYRYNGQSVIDYVAISPGVKGIVKNFIILPLTELSDHRPLLCQLSPKVPLIAAEILKDLYENAPKKPKWEGEATMKEFMENLDSEDMVNQLQEVIDSPLETKEHIYAVNNKLINVFQSAIGDKLSTNSDRNGKTGKHFSKKKRRSRFRPKNKWFDAECIRAKRELNTLTKKYGKTPTNDRLRILFYSKKKDYKRLLKKKQLVVFRELNQDMLTDNKLSWKCVKKL